MCLGSHIGRHGYHITQARDGLAGAPFREVRLYVHVSANVCVGIEQYIQLMEVCKRSPRSLVATHQDVRLCADAMAFSGLVGGDEISQLFDNGVYELLLVPFVFTELSKHVVLAAGVLHPAHNE